MGVGHEQLGMAIDVGEVLLLVVVEIIELEDDELATEVVVVLRDVADFEVGKIEPSHCPNASWHPVPQYSLLEPHQLFLLQQLPHWEP